jgi:hypothetical protein
MYPSQDTVESLPAPAHLSETAVGLARAEIGLGLVYVRYIVARAISALLATIVASAFAQLAVLVLVLSPVLTQMLPLGNLLVATGLTGVLSLLAALVAMLAHGRAQRTARGPAGECLERSEL